MQHRNHRLTRPLMIADPLQRQCLISPPTLSTAGLRFERDSRRGTRRSDISHDPIRLYKIILTDWSGVCSAPAHMSKTACCLLRISRCIKSISGHCWAVADSFSQQPRADHCLRPERHCKLSQYPHSTFPAGWSLNLNLVLLQQD